MAGEGAKELPRGRVSQALQERTSRRGFLKGAAVVGAGAVGALAGKQAYDIEQAADRRARKTLSAVGDFFAREKNKLDQAGVEVMTKRDFTGAEFKAAFPKLSGDARNGALEQVRRAKGVMLNLLENKVIRRIAGNEELIRRVARQNSPPEGLFLGLVIAESLGDERAISAAGAKGLTQMMDNVAQKHNLRVTDDESDERFNPEKILPATAEELGQEYQKFGNWGLAFWSWHLGDPQLYGAIKIYLKETHGVDLEDVNVVAVDQTDEAQAAATAEAQRRLEKYKKAIADYGITVFHLLENPTIKQNFSGEEMDLTTEYVYRIISGSEGYLEEKAKLGI